ncbi:MAG: transglutaminase domain-containing protein [Pirellulales bacterium]|nr:transglutaminase domain-containing protein [Pirellulales bacterium]
MSVNFTVLDKFSVLLAITACGLAPYESANAQIRTAEENPYRRFGETQISRYQVGATVKARNGPVQQVLAMVAVPFTCPEQEVQIVDQDISPHVDRVDYRPLNEYAEGGARQLLITIPYLPGGAEARAIITFEVHTRTILPPRDTASLEIPAKPDRSLKRFLGKSPLIETKHGKIKKTLREIEDTMAASPDEPATAWQRVEAIYDFVQNHVKYVEGPDKSAVNTLNDASGDCQNISALFVALCRTSKIPARIVWVHEHNYAEFCLADAEGNLHWYPCESSGTRAFGEMPLARTILQKGDNFRVPERPRDRLRYASNFMVAEGLPGSSKPRVRYIQEQL